MAIISVVVTVFFALLAVVPSVPPMPTGLEGPLTQFSTMVGTAMGFLQHFLTPPLFNAAVFIAIGLFTFDIAWSVFWFVIVKVPFISQHIHR